MHITGPDPRFIAILTKKIKDLDRYYWHPMSEGGYLEECVDEDSACQDDDWACRDDDWACRDGDDSVCDDDRDGMEPFEVFLYQKEKEDMELLRIAISRVRWARSLEGLS